MQLKRDAKIALMTTALGALLPAAPMAQEIRINEDALEGTSQQCRSLAELVETREQPFDEPNRQRIVAAINDDEQSECTAIAEQLQSGTTDRASQSESQTLSEEVDLSEQVEIEGDARVTVPDPNVDVEVPAPNVRVTKEQPQVDITQEPAQIELRQAQPQIEVEIPEIVVRVDIPAPELFVLQADPDVRVSHSDPQIEVSQGEPVVSVRQAEPQLNVDIDLQDDADPTGDRQTTADNREQSPGDAQSVEGDVATADAEPQIEIVEAEGQPQLRYQAGEPSLSYEGAEPRISVRMAEQPTVEVSNSGEPVITVETPEEREQRRQSRADQQPSEGAQQQASADRDGAGAAQGTQGEAISVRDLMTMDVVTSGGEELGEPDAFIELDGQTYLVAADGGFLGIGEKQVPVPLARVSLRDDQLVLSQMTEEEINAADNFEYDSDLEISQDQTVSIAR
ncbi:PRC-barrel domain-containing protein [Paracoccus sp. TK19116]|uniref:PRC-barrel domain-containing protein n=1 Tax=Paracoccus albicereus TaxID=2922394 RepID=A0ABT1MPQ7_9RHOB|nr:PRC-barrel domain-containing protein [Paracoccus albicereus]MCQ0970181.1 PRC-barrel domain-containing protein [Paracoccus albicereus]